MMNTGARFFRQISALALLGLVATRAVSAAADTPPSKDYVDLSDGSRIEGTIVDLKTGTSVTLELSPGVRTTIPWASVRRVGHAQAPAAAPAVAPAPAPAVIAPPAPVAAPAPAPAAAPAPGSDVVALKDGTRVSGRIVDQQPGKYVIIQTATGTRTLTWDVVSEVTSGVAAPAPIAAPPPAVAPAPIAPPPPPAAAPAVAAATAPAAPEAVAAAEEGGTGPWIVSLDRLFGLGVWTVTQSESGQSQSTNGISFSALVGTTSPDAVPAIAYHTPRVALDYKLGQGASGITVGGSVGFFLGNSSTSPPGGGSSTSGPGLNMYLVEVRGGYSWAIDKRWAFWPRAGLSFFQYSQSNSVSGQSVSESASGVAIDLEPTLVLRATPNLGLTASALADIGVGGSESVTGSSSVGLTSMNFGLTFGALASF